VVFLVASLLIALSVSDLGVVLSIVGATGSTVVSYILPGVFYYNMFGAKIARNADNISTHSTQGAHRNHNDGGGHTVVHSSSGSLSINSSGAIVGGITAESSESARANSDAGDVDSEDSHEHLDGKHASWKLVLAKVQLIVGLVIMPVCLVAIFLK
jgi:Transmembrane amino acid transporter protein